MPINMAGLKKMLLNSLHVLPNVKVLAIQDSQPNKTHYIYPYDTHMDGKKKL